MIKKIKEKQTVSLIVVFSVLALIAIGIFFVIFKDVHHHEFYFFQDEFFILTKFENFSSFAIQNPLDLGTANTASLLVTFFDRLYYSLFFGLHISIYSSQKIFYLLKLLILILIPFIGLRKIGSNLLDLSDNLIIFIISLWYSFNTFTLVYWHTTAFALTLLICYSLAPLAFYFYHQAVFGASRVTQKIITVLLIFLMSFAVYLFLVFVLLLIIYTLLYTFLGKRSLLNVIRNILLLIVLYVPFVSIYYLLFNDFFLTARNTVNTVGGESYGNLQGGVLYPFLMWFSWGIYTNWHPRNIYTFTQYFKTFPSILAPFIIYGLILYQQLRNKLHILTTVFMGIFLFFIFFIKAAQKPFGGLYVFLIKHSFIFRIFRSPDNKFSFGIVFALCILLLLSATKYKKKVFVPLVIFVICVQGYLLFSGVIIKGQDTLTSSDRIISVPKEYTQTADYLNSHATADSYVMPLPSYEFGHYILNNKRYIGEDLLPKLSFLPFLYLSDYGGLTKDAYDELHASLIHSDVSVLRKFPVKYFIVRHDIATGSPDDTNKHIRYVSLDPTLYRNLRQSFKEVYNNRLFEIYENPNVLPLITAKNASFTMLNPVTYEIHLSETNDQNVLAFFQTFHSDWRLYTNKPRLDIAYLWQKPVYLSSHRLVDGYANGWTINGTEKILYLYFMPQAIFSLSCLICFSYFLLLVSVLGVRLYNENRGKLYED